MVTKGVGSSGDEECEHGEAWSDDEVVHSPTGQEDDERCDNWYGNEFYVGGGGSYATGRGGSVESEEEGVGLNFNWWHLSTGGETVCPYALTGRLKRVLEEREVSEDWSEAGGSLSGLEDAMDMDGAVGRRKLRAVGRKGKTAGLSSGSLMLWQQLF